MLVYSLQALLIGEQTVKPTHQQLTLGYCVDDGGSILLPSAMAAFSTDLTTSRS